jgi:putative transposase
MPNHFHLLLHEKAEGGISIFMKKLLTGYSMYFNKKNDRSGGLFEGTFRARHVDKDGYLEYLYSYIHLNPIKLIEPDWKEKGLSDQSKTLKYLENYLYSSYIDYLGADRIEGKIIGRTNFPEYFVSESDFVEEIENCLAYHEEQKEKDGPLFL